MNEEACRICSSSMCCKKQQAEANARIKELKEKVAFLEESLFEAEQGEDL